jgi:hypothetical protein
VDSSGTERVLYCANQSDNSIGEYRIQPDGTLQRIGKVTVMPVSGAPMLIDPQGTFLWLQREQGWLKGFRIESDGHLTLLNYDAIPLVAGLSAFTPAISWSGPKPVIQIAHHDLGPLLGSAIAGTFTQTGPIKPALVGIPTGTLLPDGRAFILGWRPAAFNEPDMIGEIYDPKTHRFSSAGITLKSAYPIARLRDGRFLITRGKLGDPGNPLFILDPITRKVSPSGSLKAKCFHDLGHPLLLTDGRVLFPYRPGSAPGFDHPSAECEGEIYNPSTGKSVDLPREISHFGVFAVLPDGRLLVLPPIQLNRYGSPEPRSIAYTYDLATGRMAPVSGVPDLEFEGPVALKDGTLLFLTSKGSGWPQSPELFDPAASKFIRLGEWPKRQQGGALIPLLDGRVLIIGTGSAELFDPVTRALTPTGPMTTVRWNPAVVVLGDGSVLFAGGEAPFWPPGTAEIYHLRDTRSGSPGSSGDR